MITCPGSLARIARRQLNIGHLPPAQAGRDPGRHHQRPQPPRRALAAAPATGVPPADRPAGHPAAGAVRRPVRRPPRGRPALRVHRRTHGRRRPRAPGHPRRPARTAGRPRPRPAFAGRRGPGPALPDLALARHHPHLRRPRHPPDPGRRGLRGPYGRSRPRAFRTGQRRAGRLVPPARPARRTARGPPSRPPRRADGGRGTGRGGPFDRRGPRTRHPGGHRPPGPDLERPPPRPGRGLPRQPGRVLARGGRGTGDRLRGVPLHARRLAGHPAPAAAPGVPRGPGGQHDAGDPPRQTGGRDRRAVRPPLPGRRPPHPRRSRHAGTPSRNCRSRRPTPRRRGTPYRSSGRPGRRPPFR